MLQIPLQLEYPQIPGAPQITGNTTIGEIFNYLYSLLVVSGIIIALIIIAWAGLTFLISGENINRKLQAKDQIISALLGLFILLGSYIILSTLDPNLTIISLPPSAPTITLAPVTPQNFPQTYPSGYPEIIDSYEQDTLSLISFLESKAWNIGNLFLAAEVLSFIGNVNSLKDAKTCDNTNAVCIPKGLKAVPGRCEWKSKPEEELAKLVEGNKIFRLRDAIENLLNAKEVVDLKNTLTKISNCQSSTTLSLLIEKQAEEKGYLDYFKIPSNQRGPLYFYCFKK